MPGSDNCSDEPRSLLAFSSEVNPPPHLYKYRALTPETEARVQAIFERQELWFAPPETFNDPFEARFDLYADASREAKERFLSDILAADHPGHPHIARARAREAFDYGADLFPVVERSIRENLGASARRDPAVLSLCARCDHVLLWSHYADSHRGICLGFRTDRSDSLFSHALPVKYRPDFPRVSLYESTPDERFYAACLTKADVWSYEEEWRVVAMPPPFYRSAGLFRFPPDALAKVVLGALIADECRAKVLEWVQAYPSAIEVAQAQLLPNQYGLSIETLGAVQQADGADSP